MRSNSAGTGFSARARGEVAIVLLLSDPGAQTRVSAAIAAVSSGVNATQAVQVTDWAAVSTILRKSAVRCVVFDPYIGDAMSLDQARLVRDTFPSVPLVAYGKFRNRLASDVMRLARAGIADVVSFGEDDSPDALKALFTRLAFNEFADLLDILVLPTRSPTTARLVTWAGRTPCRDLSIAALADELNCHPNTLRSHMRSDGLPPLQALIGWRRLAEASRLLDDGGRTEAAVAHLIGFEHGASLRALTRRLCGLSPRQLQRDGGQKLVLERFRLFILRRYRRVISDEFGQVPFRE